MSIMASNQKLIASLVVMSLLSVIMSGCTGLGSNVPNADLSADRTEINLGETVNFDARDSSTPSPTIIDEFVWKFEMGTPRQLDKVSLAIHFSILDFMKSK